MTRMNTRAVLALCLVLPACGQALVEFSDPGTDASDTDTTDTDTTGTDAIDTDTTGTDAIDTDTTGTDAIDTDTTDTDATDTDTTGTDTTDTDTTDTDTTDTDTTGTDTTDTDTTGTDTTGTDTTGTDTTGTDTADAGLDAGDTGTIIVVPTDAGDAGDASDASDGGPSEAGLDAGDASSPDADTTAPVVVSTDPLPDALEVSITKRLTVIFSEPMDDATLDDTSFTLYEGLTPIPGTVTYEPSDFSVTFVPDEELDLDTLYTATLTADATDSVGNPLEQDHIWNFTTSACAQSMVDLGSAENFAVVAGSTVTSTGATLVTGDLGVSPGTAVEGFPPGLLYGNLHAGDPTAAQAVADLTTGYNDAAGRTLCAVTVDGNLGGQTLTPGLYKSTSSLEISSGDLTLDAQGDEDAVFIFQMASTLTTTAGRQIVLSGDAQASNVFWQVGTSATLGTTSIFHGTVLADQAITLNSGTTLNGRALARIAAVSLDSNIIIRPEP